MVISSALVLIPKPTKVKRFRIAIIKTGFKKVLIYFKDILWTNLRVIFIKLWNLNQLISFFLRPNKHEALGTMGAQKGALSIYI